MRQGIFLPRVNFQCRLSYGVRTPPCAIACINICTHVQDPVVHVRVRWIMETLKHPARTQGWAAQLCRSWLSPGKTQPEFPLEEIPLGQYGQYSCKTWQKSLLPVKVSRRNCRHNRLLEGFLDNENKDSRMDHADRMHLNGCPTRVVQENRRVNFSVQTTLARSRHGSSSPS